MTGSVSVILHAGCAALCALWAVLVPCVGRSGAAVPLAVAAIAGAVWATVVALTPDAPLAGIAGIAEVARSAIWLTVLLLLCRRMAGARASTLTRPLAWLGLAVAALAVVSHLPDLGTALGSSALLARPGIALLVVIAAENLYRNAPEGMRWHVVLPSIVLGGLAAYDVVLYAYAALSGTFPAALADARPILTALAVPLLALAAARDRRFRRATPMSRDLVFHGATLVAAGTFLFGVGITGEALRRLGTPWAGVAQVGLLAAAFMTLAVALSARSVRSRLRRLATDHFFLARYDYRREWLRCVAILSAPEAEASAEQRAIRSVADAVDSPGGVLLLRDPGNMSLRWGGSWNGPAAPLSVAAHHPLIAALRDGTWIAQPGADDLADLRTAFPPLWLAVPLAHHRDGLLGVILVARPRAPITLDSEAYDLLRTLGREVAMFLAERRSAQMLADAEGLRDYAGRFAFVAHDVKTVATQLRLLLANAEDNITDPEFQQDMLSTVRASATRIDALIARLRTPEDQPLNAVVDTTERLRRIARGCRQPVRIEGAPAMASITPDAFDTAVTHLLDNAADASPAGASIRVHVREVHGLVVVDITDRGEGMAPEFVRDALFRPLATSKRNGNGIGAWQARELARRAGGDLEAVTRPGEGTTMRLSLPRAVMAASADGREAVIAGTPLT